MSATSGFRTALMALVTFIIMTILVKRFYLDSRSHRRRSSSSSDHRRRSVEIEDGEGDEAAGPTVVRRKKKKEESARKKKERERREKLEQEQNDDSLPRLILLMGIPGSGKSTWAKEYTFRIDSSFDIVSSDDIRSQLTGDINDQSRNDEVWEMVVERVQTKLKQGRNVILDATNTRTDKRRQLVKQLPPCRRTLKPFPINKAIAKMRIAKDVEQGVVRSQVPDGVVEVMSRQFNESLVTSKDEGWVTGTT